MVPLAKSWQAVLLGALVLGGCEMSLGGAGADQPTGEGPPISAENPAEAGAARASDIPAQDVESPDAFQVTDKGLWDGRPSLGGIWVAHPDVGAPQRVIIRNPVTGKSVVGALFRREKDVPGPSYQVSSDAAAALGMLAGQPGELSVTALKRIEPEKKPEPEAPPPVVPEAADGEEAAKAADVSALPAATADEPAATEADSAESIAAEAAAAIGAVPVEGAEGEAGAAVEAPPPAPTGKPLPKPFVEIGFFQQEANAQEAITKLTEAGLAAQIVAGTSKGAPVFRVLVGPALSIEQRNQLIAQLKSMGYDRAKAVKG